CLIRSMSHGNSDHDGGTHVCLTGHSRPLENTPCIGSVAARLRPSQANLPSYVWLQNLDADVRPWYLTGGFLGAGHAPLLVGKGADNAAATGFRMNAFDPPADVPRRRMTGRHSLLAAWEDESGAASTRGPASESMRRYQERAF